MTPADTSQTIPDPIDDSIDNVVEPGDATGETEPATDAGNDVPDSGQTTMPAEDTDTDMTEQGDTTDTTMPVADPDSKATDPVIPVEEPDNATGEPQEPADNTDEVVSNPGDNVPSPVNVSIAEALLQSPDYQILLTLIEQVDLTLTLDGDNEGNGWTLFAFPDTAYGDENFVSVTDEQTRALVWRHIFSGRLTFSEIMPGMLGMTEGIVDVVQDDDGAITIGGARVVARDRVFANGVIHFVDKVLEEF